VSIATIAIFKKPLTAKYAEVAKKSRKEDLVKADS
jgi:hypothetical protein